MLVADLLRVLDRLAPGHLSQPGDNSGLLVGDESQDVQNVLAALDLTPEVFAEAVAGGCDTVLTHHPLLFTPFRSLVESDGRQRLLRGLVTRQMNLIACHTNVDAAPGGLAEIAGEALGLGDMTPLEPAAAGWFKLVGFVPEEAIEGVARAVFAAGAGGIGNYSECAFAGKGVGWFTPGLGSEPLVGEVSRPERVSEIRWETVAPKGQLGAVVRAFVGAHPYEEPAFDLYPIEDVLPGAGLGRIGKLDQQISVEELGRRAARVFESAGLRWCGDGGRRVRQVCILPGSGRRAIELAIGRCEALITGDVSYHDGQEAVEKGLALIDIPHEDMEWWAFKRWTEVLKGDLASAGVRVAWSDEWTSPWRRVGEAGGSEGGPSA